MATTATTTAPLDLGVSGLASGFDWRSLVDQLAQVQRAPETRLQSDQAKLQQQKSAYGSINTQLTSLQTAVTSLTDPTLYDSRTTQTSDSTLGTATAATGAPQGTYTFNVTQLAVAATLQGSTGIGGPLSTTDDVSGVVLATAGFHTPVTDGTITVNGKQVTIASTDTLQDVFDNIFTATGGDVTGSYDASTDKISFSGAGEIVLGSVNDTSNFLQVSRLQNNGTGAITSTSALGGVNLTTNISGSNLATAVTDDGGNGEFTINGVSINFDPAADSISNVLNRINSSSAGVTASYDTVNDRFVLTNKATGDVGISMQDVTGNFLAATGLSSGALQRGSNLLYNINGGGQLSSQSNTITDTSSGLTGLSVSVLKPNSSFTISVGADTDKIKTAINTFLTQYNKAQSVIDTQTASSTDAQGNVTAGVLASDRDISSLAGTLRSTAFDPSSSLQGVIKSLADLGISSNGNDNSLTISDQTKMDDALQNNLSAVTAMFTDATNGMATKLAALLNKTAGDSGTLVAQQNNLTKQSSDIDTKIADMERVVMNNRQSMIDEFTAMETAESQTNQQLAYLQKSFP